MHELAIQMSYKDNRFPDGCKYIECFAVKMQGTYSMLPTLNVNKTHVGYLICDYQEISSLIGLSPAFVSHTGQHTL
jgi:hypothetical protein